MALCGLWLATGSAFAGEARIVKVLPHYLDLEGRTALAPSLYERDAYQVVLRDDPSKRSGMRFDIQWRGRGLDLRKVKVRLEMRTSNLKRTQPIVLEESIRAKKARGWLQVPFTGESYQTAGEVIAWRVSLWEDNEFLTEQRSFLW